MSKETMKLAASVLKGSQEYKRGHATFVEAVEELKEALAKPDFWEGYVPEPDKRQQALDKKAENARELGLDYEPAQQEPVAYLVDGDLYYPEEIDWESLQEQGHTVASLYTQAQRKPLTDEEIKGIYEDCDAPTGGQFTLAFARAIEAKLREKNQ